MFTDLYTQLSSIAASNTPADAFPADTGLNVVPTDTSETVETVSQTPERHTAGRRPLMTDDVRAKIVSEYLGGEPSTRLAEKYGTTRQTILTYVKNAGVTPRPARKPTTGPGGNIPADVRDQIISAYQNGKSSTEIAKEFGSSPITVLGVVRAAGVPVNSRGAKRRYSDTDRAAIVEAYATGDSALTVAKRYGVAVTTVLRFARENGVEVRSDLGRSARVTPDIAERMLTAYQSGQTAEEVGQQFGVSAVTVLSHVRKAGGTVRRSGRIATAM